MPYRSNRPMGEFSWYIFKKNDLSMYIYIYHTSLLFEGFWLGFPKRVYKHYIHLNCLETNEWFFLQATEIIIQQKKLSVLL